MNRQSAVHFALLAVFVAEVLMFSHSYFRLLVRMKCLTNECVLHLGSTMPHARGR